MRRRRGDAGTVRPIRYMGDPGLRTECDPVRSFDADLRRLIDDMFASMYANDGAGLAANQIGVSLQVFVYDCDDDAGRNHVGHVVNPVLVSADGETVSDDEGCLSLPGLRFPTPRYDHAVVEGVDMTGAPLRVEGTGYFARCLQHETGHLKGRLYVDTLQGDARKAALRAVRAADWS
ncbi:peptide deformylase [Actinoallomurus rhizosphaericola]|uniref:peptide deformylase n=1 Tax=Actinoallomurus rhizosphaericola TaxID=2952536 RepID=UPI002091FA53|nr:peptide deformylase [Actinoallomurus rhizosphaericola]MCO5996180.1 peptide deformylase [Actinoallomurus rhizosphaericola]